VPVLTSVFVSTAENRLRPATFGQVVTIDAPLTTRVGAFGTASLRNVNSCVSPATR
jgi:hypothetical protein